MGENQVAGFWIRLGANLLDGIIVSLPLWIIAGIITGDFENEPISNLIYSLYALLVPVYWNGYTIGKRICGIRIRKFDFLEPPGIGTIAPQPRGGNRVCTDVWNWTYREHLYGSDARG